MPVSCHFRDCKALLVASLTHVRGAIADTRPLPLPLPRYGEIGSYIGVIISDVLCRNFYSGDRLLSMKHDVFSYSLRE